MEPHLTRFIVLVVEEWWMWKEKGLYSVQYCRLMLDGSMQ